jgi:hypothetical protein
LKTALLEMIGQISLKNVNFNCGSSFEICGSERLQQEILHGFEQEILSVEKSCH